LNIECYQCLIDNTLFDYYWINKQGPYVPRQVYKAGFSPANCAGSGGLVRNYDLMKIIEDHLLSSRLCVILDESVQY